MVQGKSRRHRGKLRRARACGNKQAMSQSDAVGQAMFMTKKQGVKVLAYKCPFCHLANGSVAWHVGHAQRLRRRLGR